HYKRMFEYSFGNPPQVYSDPLNWQEASISTGGNPSGWNGVQGIELWIPGAGGGKLWVKCKPGETADPVDITQQTMKIAPADIPIVNIDGASNIVLRGLTFKNGYWGMKLTNSIGNT